MATAVDTPKYTIEDDEEQKPQSKYTIEDEGGTPAANTPAPTPTPAVKPQTFLEKGMSGKLGAWDVLKHSLNPLAIPGDVSEMAGKVGDWAQGKAEQKHTEELGNIAKGTAQPVKPTELGSSASDAYDLLGRTAHMVSGATSPKSIAIGAGALVAPEIVGPALIAHGGLGAVKSGTDIARHGLNPENAEQGLGSLAEAAGGGATLGQIPEMGGMKNTLTGKALSTAESPEVAAQRALRPGPKGGIKAQRDITGAAPYLEGADDLAAIQDKVKTGKKEVWKPYSDALKQIGDREIEGPDGTTTVQNLEDKRLELSAERQKLQKMLPTDRATALQKDADLRANETRYKAITDALDPELRSAGIDPEKIRTTHGNLKGVEKLVEGRNTLTEASRPYGVGRALEDFDITKPLRSLMKAKEGLGDIVAGRPWWSGKPTDVAANEAFNVGAAGPKPDFTIPNPPPSPSGKIGLSHLEPIGPKLPAQPFELNDIRPPEARGGLWQQQVGALPEIGWQGPTSPYRAPIGPQMQHEAPLGSIHGTQLPLDLAPRMPGPLGEISNVNTPRNVPELQRIGGTAENPVGMEQERGLPPVGTRGGEGTLGRIGGDRPEIAYRAQDKGNIKLNPKSHAHATESPEEAERYKEGREEIEGKPQEVRRIDLRNLDAKDYSIFEGPNGKRWIKFNRQLGPHEFEPLGTAEKKR